MKFVLHRIVLESTEVQAPMFPVSSEQKRMLLEKVIALQPFVRITPKKVWGVGNLEVVNDEFMFFCFGNDAEKREGQLDRKNKIFFQAESSEAKFARGFYDTRYQVVALEKHSKLPKEENVAKYLQQVLNESLQVKLHDLLPQEVLPAGRNLRVNVKVIYNPFEFIKSLREAYRVNEFSVALRRPNVWDADNDFQQPLTNTLERVGGKIVTTVFTSDDDFSREHLVDITNAVAASGDKVRAKIEDEKGRSPKFIEFTETQQAAIVEQKFIEKKRRKG